MKIILTIIFFIGSFYQSKAIDINQLRKDYILSVDDSDKADELYKKLKAVKNPDALILAYLGSVEAIQGKHAWNPVNKLSYLKKGFATIDKAVAKDPNQLEVRFLRFSLQYYVPAFLGYSKNLTVDKDRIVALVKSNHTSETKMDKSVFNTIVNFMIDSEKCNAQEIAVLRKALV
ncbi:hypothetical protein [Pedobacter arcticus]|uniref:hypothetical protein n=1 Tax=Pedobacter arcticus TaxID=752140 RepID=UPI0002F3CA43|nr:hypothetical protein [Pedobacter arcticus]